MEFTALLLDIGNTRLKWGVLSDGRIGRTGSIRHEVLAKSGMTALNRRLPRNVDAVLASNVAGPTHANYPRLPSRVLHSSSPVILHILQTLVDPLDKLPGATPPLVLAPEYFS